MSETSELLRATAERLFEAHLDPEIRTRAEAGHWPAALWTAIEEAGLSAALAPEAAGGAGLDFADAFAVLDVAGFARAPVPLAETMIASRLLGLAGLAVPAGPLTLAPVSGGTLRIGGKAGAWQVAGEAARAPWARDAAAIVVVADGPDGPMLACVPRQGVEIEPGANLANEPRDHIRISTTLDDRAVAKSPVDVAGLKLLGAAARTAQIAGGIRFVLGLTVDYANTRVQFGKPIGRFQAIQQSLAVLAEQAAAAEAAASLAADALQDTPRPVLVAAAKARAGEAVGLVASISHQTHGAIGFTREYDLHRATRRLWSWRDEFGSEAEWQRLVGRAAIDAGADALWAFMTAA